MSNIKVGIQLYTVREPLKQDFEGTKRWERKKQKKGRVYALEKIS